MQRLFLIFLLPLFFIQTALSDEMIKTLRLGVLSFRPKEVTTAQWQALTQEFNWLSCRIITAHLSRA